VCESLRSTSAMDFFFCSVLACVLVDCPWRCVAQWLLGRMGETTEFEEISDTTLGVNKT